MTEIRFYHLKSKSLEQALPEILAKALDKGHRIIVKHTDQKSIDRINESLWNYKPESFLPHGVEKDGNADKQPIWLTIGNDNPNGADVLILTGGAEPDSVENYKLCCEFLEDSNEQGIAASRARWKDYNEAGMEVTYWQQTASGSWDKKA